MEDFKKIVKMKCGGSVKTEYCSGGKMRKKAGGKVSHDDIVEDKKLIKKAFKMHDAQEHPGKHTNLAKLKKGGPTGMDMRKVGRNMARANNQRGR